MAKTKPTHEVIHPSLYLMVAGELTEVPVGSNIALSGAKAKAMVKRGFVKSLKAGKVVETGGDKE